MVEAEQAYQLADTFSAFRVGSKRPCTHFLPPIIPQTRGRAPWKGEDLFPDNYQSVVRREHTVLRPLDKLFPSDNKPTY
jgi:hypothetical protein